MAKEQLYKQAVSDTKTMQTLLQRNARRAVEEALRPTVSRMLKEGLAEAGDEEMPDEAPVPISDEEEDIEIDEMSEEGGEGKATIDLDKLSAEMEDEMRRESDMELDLEEEGDDAMDDEFPPKEDEEVPVQESDDADADDVEVSDEEVKEAFRAIVGEVESPPKGDPDQLDPNTDGKAVGLADKQKQQNDKPWEEVDPPAAQDFTQKEAYYKKVIGKGVMKCAQVTKQRNTLAKKIQEMKLDQLKLALITDLFNEHRNVDRSVKVGILEKFDSTKTVREAKALYSGAKAVLQKHSRKTVTESRGNRRNRAPSAPAGRGTGKPQQKTMKEHAVAKRWKTLADLG